MQDGICHGLHQIIYEPLGNLVLIYHNACYANPITGVGATHMRMRGCIAHDAAAHDGQRESGRTCDMTCAPT